MTTSSTDAASPIEELYYLVYAKSRVTLHPSPYARDNIPGYLCLLKRPRREDPPSVPSSSKSALPSSSKSALQPQRPAEVLLSWLPEDLVKDRSETAKFVDVELREAEGATERGEEEEEYTVRDPFNGKTIRMREVVEGVPPSDNSGRRPGPLQKSD